jgi:hypothetical protein
MFVKRESLTPEAHVSYQLLSQIITHFPCLSPIETYYLKSSVPPSQENHSNENSVNLLNGNNCCSIGRIVL